MCGERGATGDSATLCLCRPAIAAAARPDAPPLLALALSPPPLLQTVTQGTYNPLWHQVHHGVATARLAASGKVRTQRVSLADTG